MRVALLATVLLLAGCVAPEGTVLPESARESATFVDPIAADHDHKDPTIHAYAWNLEQRAHHPLAGAKGKSAFAHALDVAQGRLFVGTWGETVDKEAGFWVFDLADPDAPAPLGRFQLPGSVNGDASLEATDDGKFAVLSTEPFTSAGDVSPFGPGLYLVDVSDPASPKLAHHVPGRGVHSVEIHTIGGRDIVFAGATADRFTVYEIVRSPVPLLRPIGTLPIGEGSVVLDDPLLGVPVLYASNGFAGYEVYDVSTPEAPKLLATWNIPDRGDKYYIHTSTVEFREGKRIVVVTSEDWLDYPSALWVLDATDLAAFEVLSTWQNPGGHPADDLRFSLHNPQLVNGTLWLAHYHAGVWAIDLSTPQARADPQVKGVFIPGEDVGGSPLPPMHAYRRTQGRGFSVDSSPMVMDVVVRDGVAYVADAQTGLYALGPAWG